VLEIEKRYLEVFMRSWDKNHNEKGKLCPREFYKKVRLRESKKNQSPGIYAKNLK